MQALGLIETRGLIAAIESADTMLKSADVTLIDKTYVGGGLVSIAVSGGVAAVKAAVEAGAAAVKQINGALLVSQHIIPRPHDEIDVLLTAEMPAKNEEKQLVEFIGGENPEDAAEKEAEDSTVFGTLSEKLALEEPEPLPDKGTETDEQSILEPEPPMEKPLPVQPKIKKTVMTDLNADEINKAAVDKLVLEHGAEKTVELLSTLRVTKLRSLAREYENLGIAGREISRADGKTLLSELEKYYS